MNKKNKYWVAYADKLFSLDKAYEKAYNENRIPQKSKSIFDDDEIAGSA